MGTLPVAHEHDSKRLLVDEMGDPIWPVSSPLEMDLLASTAGRVGSALRLAHARDALPEQVRRGNGTVVSLEPSLRSEGRLYAHLTKRQFIALNDTEQLSEVEDVEVVVCSSEAISTAFLHHIYDPVRPVSPGLVYGRTPHELHAQVLRAAAVAQLTTPVSGTYVQVCPELGTGSPAERSWVTHAIALDAAVLAVLTHSDGLDAPLTSALERGRLLICPIRQPLSVAPHRTPECQHSGWCHRVQMPVEDAFVSGELVAPREFRARVLIWSTCFGLLDRGAPLDRQWSIVHQFNMNPHIGVVLTKWRGAFGHGPFGDLVMSLASGVNVGRAVSAFNAAEGTLERGAQFAILGDPRVAAPFNHLHPDMEAIYPSTPPTVEHAPDTSGAATSRDEQPDLAELLRDCVAIPLRFHDHEREAVAARGRFAEAHAELQRGGDSARGFGELQEAALDCLRRYGDVIRGWSPRVVAQRFSMGTPCAHCGELKTEAINVFAPPWGARRIGACPRCQIAGDLPADFDFDFRVTEDRALELVGQIPGGLFSGIAVVWSTTPARGAVQRWPVAGDGTPLRRIRLDVEWPRATARVTVWMMFELQYVMLNHRIMGAAHPPAQSRVGRRPSKNHADTQEDVRLFT